MSIPKKNIIRFVIGVYLLSQMILGGIVELFYFEVVGRVLIFTGAILLIFSKKVIVEKRYFRWFLLFALVALLSIIWSIDVKLSVYVFKNIIPIACMAILLMDSVHDENDFYAILKIYYYCVIIMCGYLALFVGLTSISAERSGAEIPIFENWNLNSIAVDCIFGIFVGFLLQLRNRGQKHNKATSWVIYLLCVLIMLYITFSTGSRRALLILFVLFGTSFFLLSKLSFISKIVVSSVCCILAIVAIFSDMFYDILGARILEAVEIAKGSNKGDTSRLYLLLYGLEWFKEKPLLGYGINCYRALSNDTIMFAGKNFYAHNNYIELLVDIGVLGIIVYYIPIIKLIFKSLTSDSESKRLASVLLITILFSDIGSVGYYLPTTQLFISLSFIVMGRSIDIMFKNKS